MIKEIKGDIFKEIASGKYDVAVHGCNCQKNMGAGLAKSFAENYPQVEIVDQKFDKPHMGGFSTTDDPMTGTVLINVYSQYWYGKAFGEKGALKSQTYSFDTKQKRYEAIQKAFSILNKHYKHQHFLIPQIGAGLAGGDWKVIKKIITTALKDCSITFVYYAN